MRATGAGSKKGSRREDSDPRSSILDTQVVNYMKPVHKSGGAPWVRIASSVQSWLDGLLLPNAPPAETARWKRCVPRLTSINALIAKVFYLRTLQLYRHSGKTFASPRVARRKLCLTYSRRVPLFLSYVGICSWAYVNGRLKGADSEGSCYYVAPGLARPPSRLPRLFA